MNGELTRGALPGLLRLLFVGRRTGRLLLSRDRAEHRVLLRMGDVVGVDDASAEELPARLRAVLSDVLRWPEGRFAFEDLDTHAPEFAANPSPVSTGQLILESVRQLGDDRLVESGLGDTSRLLQLSTDPMLRFQHLPLGPEDGFVLSRIDGTVSASDLVDLTPLDPSKVRRSLYALLCTGMVEYVPGSGRRKVAARTEAQPPPAASPPAAPPEPPPPERKPPAAEARPEPPPAPPQPPVATPRPAPPPAPSAPPFSAPPPITVKTTWELPGKKSSAPKPAVEPRGPEQAADKHVEKPRETAEERRAEVETAWKALKGQNHFDVLGLDPSATAAQVKESYFRLARRFHPDVLHDPALADLKDKLEAVFIRVGEAYEVLRHPRSRASYEERFGLKPTPVAPAAPSENAAPAETTAPPPAPPPSSGPTLEELARLTALVKKGERLLAEQQWMDAIEWLERLVVELQGRLKARAQIALASAYTHSPKGSRRAERLLLDAIRTDDGYADAHMALARLYHASGLRVRALPVYRRVLEIQPENEEAMAAVGELEAEMPDAPEKEGGVFRKLFGKS